MDVRELFVLADRSLGDVVARITDDQWSMPMPDDFQTMSDRDRPLTLREVVSYHAYDDAWVPDVLAGLTAEQGDGPAVGADLLGDDPRTAFAALVERACAAAEAADDLGRTTHLSYGDFTAEEYLQHITTYRGLRVRDLAVAVGQDATMPPELVEGLWEMLQPQAEGWRAMGVFGPEVPVPDDAPLQARLLGLTGRQP